MKADVICQSRMARGPEATPAAAQTEADLERQAEAFRRGLVLEADDALHQAVHADEVAAVSSPPSQHLCRGAQAAAERPSSVPGSLRHGEVWIKHRIRHNLLGRRRSVRLQMPAAEASC